MSAGLNPAPVALRGFENEGKILDFSGKQIKVHGPSDRESILSSVFKDYPNLVVVDYTVPTSINVDQLQTMEKELARLRSELEKESKLRNQENQLLAEEKARTSALNMQKQELEEKLAFV